MKTPPSNPFRRNPKLFPAIVLASGISISSLSAAALTWDTDSGTPGSQGGAGTWDLSATNWNNAGTNVAWTQTNATTATNTATFAGTDAIANSQNHFVTLTLIPEPGSALLGMLGALALLRRRR